MSRDASIGVNLVGRDVSASKALNDVGKAADRVGHKMVAVSDKIIKGMALAATATAAAAIKIGVDSVKAAIEDATAARKLAITLENVTHASRKQKKAVEDYIYATEMRLGVEDNVLRPALARLVRSTESATKAQKLLNLALDISTGTGKNLDVVVAGLGKAYDGNMASLGRLGLGLDKSVLKSGNFSKVFKILQRDFQGFANKDAQTMEGRMRRVSIAFDEAKESLGYMLMDALTPYVEKLTALIPKIQEWIDANGPGIKKAIGDALPTVGRMLTKLREIGQWAIDHKEVLWEVAKAITAFAAGVKIASGVMALAAGLKTLATAFGIVRGAAAGAAIAEAAATGGVSVGPALAGMAGIAAALATYGIMSNALDLGSHGKDTKIAANQDSRWPLRSDLRTGGDGLMSNYFNRSANLGGGAPIVINVHGSIFTEDMLLRTIRRGFDNYVKRNGRGD